jgi:hypothetical protein
MSRQELNKHLVEECPQTELLCLTCGVGKPRRSFKKHTAKTCLGYLQTKVRGQEAALKRLKTEKEELMRQSAPSGESPRYVPTYLRERDIARRERAADYGFDGMNSIFR